jgi:hypothetical protein
LKRRAIHGTSNARPAAQAQAPGRRWQPGWALRNWERWRRINPHSVGALWPLRHESVDGASAALMMTLLRLTIEAQLPAKNLFNKVSRR